MARSKILIGEVVAEDAALTSWSGRSAKSKDKLGMRESGRLEAGYHISPGVCEFSP